MIRNRILNGFLIWLSFLSLAVAQPRVNGSYTPPGGDTGGGSSGSSNQNRSNQGSSNSGGYTQSNNSNSGTSQNYAKQWSYTVNCRVSITPECNSTALIRNVYGDLACGEGHDLRYTVYAKNKQTGTFCNILDYTCPGKQKKEDPCPIKPQEAQFNIHGSNHQILVGGAVRDVSFCPGDNPDKVTVGVDLVDDDGSAIEAAHGEQLSCKIFEWARFLPGGGYNWAPVATFSGQVECYYGGCKLKESKFTGYSGTSGSCSIEVTAVPSDEHTRKCN